MQVFDGVLIRFWKWLFVFTFLIMRVEGQINDKVKLELVDSVVFKDSASNFRTPYYYGHL